MTRDSIEDNFYEVAKIIEPLIQSKYNRNFEEACTLIKKTVNGDKIKYEKLSHAFFFTYDYSMHNFIQKNFAWEQYDKFIKSTRDFE